MVARLRKLYETDIKKQLMEELSLKNINQVPRLEKIVLNMGLGEAASDKGKVDGAIKDLTQISGQKAITTKARKSVASFKLREGMNIGCKVTLRKDRMYEFLDRLINISLARVRDFRGLSAKSFDKRGNYALGIKEQIVFPEINYDDVDAVRGMDVIICTTARSDEEGLALLKKFNLPFRIIEPQEEKIQTIHKPEDIQEEEKPEKEVKVEEIIGKDVTKAEKIESIVTNKTDNKN